MSEANTNDGSARSLKADVRASRGYAGHLVAIGVLAGAVIGLSLLLDERAYLWMKALHVIAVIAWMAGLLYLPRLFVYHTEAGAGSAQAATFKVMERRLLKAIMTPAMIVSAITGFWLAYDIHAFQGAWLHAKLLLIVLLFAVHGHLAASVRRFANDELTRSSRYWRIMNEVPTLAMIAIVILVIVQPFQ
ncbi:MAG: protoporphyrinogen oxidase HemJ [Pseudomonadota bacterium]